MQPVRAQQPNYQPQGQANAARPGSTTAFPASGNSGGYTPGSYRVPTGASYSQASGAGSAYGSHAQASGVAQGAGGAGQYSRGSYGSAGRAGGSGGSGKKGGGPWRVVFIVAIVVLVASLAALGAIGYQYFAQQRAYNDLEQYAEVSDTQGSGTLSLSSLSVDWDSLRAINPDIVAWVYVPDTPINYPVVQGNDNEEYLHKAFDGSTGWLASAGTIFLDSTNKSDLSDRNSALYGHHMNDGSMFATLADFVTQSNFDSHRDIYVLTPNGNYRLTTFAVVVTVGSDPIVQTSFADEASYQAYIQDKLDRSSVNQNGTVLTAADIKQSMLFSTCEYTHNDGRSVLFAAVVETTASNDPYLTGTHQGTTNLSSDTNAEMDRDY